VVRKKLGLMLVSEKNGEERVYRIAANDVAPKRKAGSDRKAASPACRAQQIARRQVRLGCPSLWSAISSISALAGQGSGVGGFVGGRGITVSSNSTLTIKFVSSGLIRIGYALNIVMATLRRAAGRFGLNFPPLARASLS
jgi:hypothetical protein